jgi:hypothetical protein
MLSGGEDRPKTPKQPWKESAENSISIEVLSWTPRQEKENHGRKWNTGKKGP